MGLRVECKRWVFGLPTVWPSPLQSPRRGSLDGDRLGEVSRLVDVAAAHVGNVVGEELQRDDSEERYQHLVHLGQFHDEVALAVEVRVPLVGDRDHRAVACEDLFDIRRELQVVRIRAGRDDDDRHEGVDEGDGAVLHLGRRVSLSVNIRDLLELERSLERHGEVEPAAEVEEVVGVAVGARHAHAHLRLRVEHMAHELRQSAETARLREQLVAHELAALRRQLHREEGEREHLSGEGLGRSDADLRASVEIDAAVRLARDGGADRVDDAEAEAAVLLRQVQRRQRVRRLAALRHRNEDVVRQEYGAAVAELRRVLDLDRDTSEGLDEVLADETGVPRRATRHDDDPPRRADPWQVLLDPCHLDHARVCEEAAAHAILKHLGLLHNLFEHEVLVRALLDLLERELEQLHLADQLHVIERLDLIAIPPVDANHLAVVEVRHLLCVLDDCRGVGRQDELVSANAEDERRAAPRADEQVRLVGTDHGQPKGALYGRERLPHGLLERHRPCLPDVVDEVGDELRIRV
mmetsp:Transcript_36236/g.95523  ORF Transcript_36236/g.95523 Transcript_36236/m.95523 type:complete len:523 (-) Transcript_36236:461-2029(-)